MTIKSDAGIYPLLEALLRKQEKDAPLTCVELYENPKVKKLVDSTNAVSDALGHMWRRGLLQRWTAPKDARTRSRFAYTWKEQKASVVPTPIVRPAPVKRGAGHRPNIAITEMDDRIMLEFEDFTITIQSHRTTGDKP